MSVIIDDVELWTKRPSGEADRAVLEEIFLKEF